MDFSGNDKHLTQRIYNMREPDICAVYPTCVLICWDPPQSVNDLSENERILQWSYFLEWTTSHTLNRKPFSATTTFSHAIIEILYPNEIIYLRIVARGNISNDIVALASTKCTINASIIIPMPWLQNSSMKCRCIFDGLLFSANGVQCIDAIPIGCEEMKATIISVRMLESSFACIIVKTVYNNTPLPIISPIVYYFIMCSKALVKQREQLRHNSIQEILNEENACAIFCGIGEMGSSAALAAHLFISSVSETFYSLRHRIFCIAYGSPRRMFVEDSLMLASSSAFSGNFLYYTGILIIADPLCGYSNTIFPNLDSKEVLKNENGLRFNVPLGIRCGPLLDIKEGCYYLRTRCSSLETLSEEESHEQLDVSKHLRILSKLLLSNTEVVLSPVIKSVKHSIEDNVIVSLTITGYNLQYKPLICILSQIGGPANCIVTSVTPLQINAIFSLVEIIGFASSIRFKPINRLKVDFTLITDFGFTLHENYIIEIPGDFSELLFLESRKKEPNAWLFSYPINLIDNAIVVEVFITNPTLKDSNKSNFLPQLSTQLIGALATISEIANYYSSKKQSVSLMTFVANVAAKVSNSNLSPQSMTPMSLQIPPVREATIFEKTLEEYVNSKKRSVSNLLSNLTTWKQRLQHGLPWISDAKYGEKLRSLLTLFDKSTPSSDTPFITLEISLFTHTLRYLRNTCGVTSVGYLTSLHQSMSFEMFYQQVYPLFLASIPLVENSAAEILLESTALWTICIIFHLRCSYVFTHIISVTGCAGSGCSTMCKSLMRLSVEKDYRFKYSQRVRNVVIRRAEEYELDDLKEILILGLSATIVVLGEYADISGLGYKATWSSIQRSLRNTKRQRLITFLSKTDELLGHSDIIAAFSSSSSSSTSSNNNNNNNNNNQEEEEEKDPVQLLCNSAVKAAMQAGKCAGIELPKRLIPVSFAPSVPIIKTSLLVRYYKISAEEFAEKLLAVSLEQLKKILANVQKE